MSNADTPIDDALQYQDLPDLCPGDAFGLHAVYSDGNRFDTVIMGTIDQVKDTVGDWTMTFDVDREAITSPEGDKAAMKAYLEVQAEKLVPRGPRHPGLENDEKRRGTDRSENRDRLGDILTYPPEEPPGWLTRVNDNGYLELTKTTPVVYTGSETDLSSESEYDDTPDYYTLESHGVVTKFTADEIVTAAAVLPEWVLDNLEEINER